MSVYCKAFLFFFLFFFCPIYLCLLPPLISSSRSWRSRFLKPPSDHEGIWVLIVMNTPQNPAVVATRSQLTLKLLAGTGSLHLNVTRQTTAQASVSTCSCKSTHILIWCSMLIPEAQQGHAAHPQRCRR